ncbi:MAG: 3-oxoacyl-[acyl-carrier protein] reductase [Pseudonocardiales bacterium]|nr:3-oxoacyl-[acyl-carrier protein] reductase [Pseudonocardiales bacterium]
MDGLRVGGQGVYDLVNKVAVVAGGSGGIGAAAARRLAAAGAIVVVGYHRDAARAETIAADLPGNGHWVARLSVDDTATVEEAARAVRERHGTVDVLVNAAGITRRIAHSDLDALDDETFDQIYAVNVRGTFALAKAFAPLLKASGDGVLINVSSLSALTGKGSSIAYCASKAAVDTMGQSLARVLAPEVRVIAISPAAVDTGFVPGRDREAIAAQARATPLRILVDPDDVAVSVLGAITHLRLATGSVVLVDGGLHLGGNPGPGPEPSAGETGLRRLSPTYP